MDTSTSEKRVAVAGYRLPEHVFRALIDRYLGQPARETSAPETYVSDESILVANWLAERHAEHFRTIVMLEGGTLTGNIARHIDTVYSISQCAIENSLNVAEDFHEE